MNRITFRKPALQAIVASALLAAATASQAAAVDVASVVTDIAAQAAPIGLIGAAVLLIYVGVKAFQWVRKALS
ncbi:major capsid protein [Acidovorax sp. A1169]|uniref:major capsid protein n=1 Tax=Acidovorax sp. A1169 TaxID=3059524 RepID=UPI002737AB26|nr:major capsid protein [Acidovorax sp. A1169]MDP4076908.1 major capsid protein [Acidovorax sp. A1169]